MVKARPRGRILAFEGPSGAGKSSLVAAIAHRTGWPALAEAWVRLTPRPSLGYRTPAELFRLEDRLLREEVRRWKEAAVLAEEADAVLLDTGPLGPLTYTWGLALLDPKVRPCLPRLLTRAATEIGLGQFGLPDRTFYLDTPLEVAGRRATAAPETHPTEWRWRHAAVGRIERTFWLGSFSEEVPPTALRLLDGRKETDRLVPAVLREAKRRAPALGPAIARRVLRRLAPPGAAPRRPGPGATGKSL